MRIMQIPKQIKCEHLCAITRVLDHFATCTFLRIFIKQVYFTRIEIKLPTVSIQTDNYTFPRMLQSITISAPTNFIMHRV